MRIGIDLRYTASSLMGTGTYAETAALGLSRRLTDGDALIAFGEESRLDGDFAKRVHYRRVPPPVAQNPGNWARRLSWDAAIDRAGLDVFFAPTGIAPLVKRCAVVVTVHDLLFEHEPGFFSPPLLALLKREIPRSVAAADRIVAVSEWTRRDLMATYNVPSDLIRVVPQALRPIFRHKIGKGEIQRILRCFSLRQPYLLTLSNHAPHKNTLFAVKAFARWIKRSGNADCRLVIAGGGPAPQAPIDLVEESRALGIEDRVAVIGRVDDAYLPALYAGAKAFLFPSLFEGWGLPPLEAIAMGTPAVVSDRGALPEAVGEAGIVLPLDEEGWVAAIDRLANKEVPDGLRRIMEQRRDILFRHDDGPLLDVLVEAVKETRQSSEAVKPRLTMREHNTGGPQSPAHPPSTMAGMSLTIPVSRKDEIRLSGCMIIKNGLRLGYPFVEAITAVMDHVDEMIVVDGESDDGTWDILTRMAAVCSKLVLSQQPWSSDTQGGRAIAKATNHALSACPGSHVLYVQADEIYTDDNLRRLRELLLQGYDSACLPFLHFRSGWWTILSNPDYVATIRCVPNRPGVASVGDGCTFGGPLGQVAPPEAFPDCVFHVGWVYGRNSIDKFKNHAKLYSEDPKYQVKAKRAEHLENLQPDLLDLSSIDEEYKLIRFQGMHPAVIAHLINQAEYDPSIGLRIWSQRYSVPIECTPQTGTPPNS
jgi:glycosyltransferase involved in cell wall biosynthesis